MNKRLLLFLFLSFLIVLQVQAHGDLEKRIIKVTKEIKISPDSAYLYIKRGKLFLQHEDFKKSIVDLNKSSILGYESIEQKLLFAKAHKNLREFERSIAFCEEILSKNRKNVRAIKLRAQIYLSQENFYKSALAFENVIRYSNQSLPENYVDASKAWESLNTEEGFQRATSIIYKGINKLGPLMSLYSRLIDLAVKQKDYNSAIETQYQIIKLSPRKESAYYKLSEFYLLNNNPENALESLNLAKTHFDKLPTRLQNTLFMKSLIENINSKKSQLKLN